MIAAEQLAYVGMQHRELGEQVCRVCAGKRWGELRVVKIFNGLAPPPHGWGPLILYTAIQDAIDAGYDMPHGCGEKPCGKDHDGYCAECARCACVDCGEDLTRPAETAA